MQSFGMPSRVRDILVDEKQKRGPYSGKAAELYEILRLQRIETPIFEYHELFSGGISPIDDESIIKNN